MVYNFFYDGILKLSELCPNRVVAWPAPPFIYNDYQ